MVAYRDDLEAARARIEALERELAEAREIGREVVDLRRKLAVRMAEPDALDRTGAGGERREPGLAWLVAVVLAYIGLTSTLSAAITRNGGAILMTAISGPGAGVFFMFGLHLAVYPSEPKMRTHGAMIMAIAVALSTFAAWIGWGL